MKAQKLLMSRPMLGFWALLAGCTARIGGTDGSTNTNGPGTVGPTSSTGSGTPGMGGGGSTTACDPTSPVATRIWRLNDKQYLTAAADLVPGVALPTLSTPGRDPDEFVSWDGQFPIQEAFAAQLSDEAYKIAELATKDLTVAGNSLVTCTAGQSEKDCAAAFVDKFASRAFRRPLEADERTRFLAIYDVGVANGTGFASGIELVVATVLQAPSFLYRTELGATAAAPGAKVQLSPYELASSLSFMLSNSIPDAELWRTAVDGTLADPAVLGQQVDRLLAVPKVQENLTDVLLSWVGAQRVLSIEKTTADLADQVFDAAVRQSMLAETRQFAGNVLWKGGSFADLFQSPRAFLDKSMAQFYGMPYSGTGLMQADLPASRSGLLTRAGLISSVRYGHNPEVFRGLLLRTKILCGEIPPPPPSVNVDAFNAQYGGLSTRGRIAVRASQTSCGGCHGFMDTLGIAYDNFGALGQVVTQVNGVAPDSAGELKGTDVDGAFTDVLDLSRRLATSSKVKECMADQIATYAIGLQLGGAGATACADQEIAKLVDDNGGLASVFKGIALNPVFATRVVGGP